MRHNAAVIERQQCVLAAAFCWAVSTVETSRVLVMRRTTSTLPDDGGATEALTQILR